jgi:selenocysteine lyase/cysteine desulfurase
VIQLDDLRRTPNALAPDYSAFRVAERLFLTGHSHQAWPDIAREGQLEAFEDAASYVDEKWDRAFAKAEAVRDGFRRLLDEPGAEIALAPNTHELVTRFLSALDLRSRSRLVTSDGEFHTLRRQLARLAEEGLEIVRLPAYPADTLAERMASELDDRTSAVLVSAVLFETSRIVPGLGALASACAGAGAELLVDAYHALGALPFRVADFELETAWIVGGGYKYLQLGEGNCFLRLPAQADSMRPVLTGWFAEFEALEAEHTDGAVTYSAGGARFAGSTYDPTSHYRGARVSAFFEERGLTPELLRTVYLHQTALLARRVDELEAPEDVLTRDRSAPLEAFGGFLAIETPHAAVLARRLAEDGVLVDARGRYLRLGPAPYLSDAQLETAMDRLAAALSALGTSVVWP